MCWIGGKKIFFFNDTATTEIYTLSLHDALPIYQTVSAITSCDAILSDYTSLITFSDNCDANPVLNQIGRAHV